MIGFRKARASFGSWTAAPSFASPGKPPGASFGSSGARASYTFLLHFSHSNSQVTRAGASQATTSTSTSTSASIHHPIATQTLVWNTTEVIGSILNTSRVSLLQLCFGWRVGNGAYSTKVEHVHEKRYRGKRLVTLTYLTSLHFTWTPP